MPDSKDTKESINKLPPQNIEAEKALLGSLMLNKDAIVKVADFLVPRDFYKRSHQQIYQAILDLFKKGDTPDFLSVSSRLKEIGVLDDVGGKSYLTELINSVPNALHILEYAKIVQKKRILRDLIGVSYDIGQMGYNEKEDPEVLVDKAERKIFSIAQKSLSQRFIPVKSALEEAFNRIDKLSKEGSGLRGIPTGFVDLDNILSGLQKSNLIILAARPSLGKSSLAIDIARNVAVKSHIPVGLFSLEMSVDEVVDRLIAGQSNVDLWRLRTGRLSEDDFSKIQEAFGVLSEAPIYIDDNPSPTALQIRAMARRLQASHGLGLAIIDYLQLMEPTNPNIGVVQQTTEISRALKSLARELSIPVLAVSQLSRAVEQRTPQIPRLSDLRQSGALEQDADVVLFIYREDKYKPNTPRKNIADVFIAKHRNGPPGKVELYFDSSKVSFRNLAKIKEETE